MTGSAASAPAELPLAPTVPALPPAPAARPALSDAACLALAAAVWLGSYLAHPFPLALGLAVATVAVGLRRPNLLLVAGLLLASTLGARSLAGLRPPATQAFRGTITLLSDPVDELGATQADVRVHDHHMLLSVAGSQRDVLAPLLAGERVTVAGTIGPPPAGEPWLVPRHVMGQLTAGEIEPAGPGTAPWRAANAVRRTLVKGAAGMSADDRSLFTGFVLGDDRAQSPQLVDDFRGSGLSHLLAVSGENVAFVMALFGPLLRRLRLRPRWALTLAVIGFFALVTRFEPSVLRASVMAGLAATAFALGRPASGLRVLGLAVAGLVLVDPLLTRSIGFQLSVAASLGILVVSPALRRSLPGPGWLSDPLAVTIGAQLAVAPLLVMAFGGVPVSSVPANLLAEPAAGLVMTWGIGGGLPAGLIGGRAARLLHLPTTAGIEWIALVARVAARLPLGQLGGYEVAALFLVAVVGLLARRRRPRRLARSVAAAVALILAVPVVALHSRPPPSAAVPGGVLWRRGGATVLILAGAPRVGSLMEALRVDGVRRLDLVIVSGSPKSGAGTVAALRHRWPPASVWAAASPQVPGAVTPADGLALSIGAVDLVVTASSPALAVAVSTPGS